MAQSRTASLIDKAQYHCRTSNVQPQSWPVTLIWHTVSISHLLTKPDHTSVGTLIYTTQIMFGLCWLVKGAHFDWCHDICGIKIYAVLNIRRTLGWTYSTLDYFDIRSAWKFVIKCGKHTGHIKTMLESAYDDINPIWATTVFSCSL